MCRDFSCFAVTFAAVGGGVNTRLQSGANVLFVSSLWAAVAETFVELAAVFFFFFLEFHLQQIATSATSTFCG